MVSNASSANADPASITLVDGIFYRFRLCFTYHPDLDQTAKLRATLHINNSLVASGNTLSNSASYPSTSTHADVFIGTWNSSTGNYDLDVSWVRVSSRGIGADGVLAF